MASVVVGSSWSDGYYSFLHRDAVHDGVEIVPSLVGKSGRRNDCADQILTVYGQRDETKKRREG